MADEGPKARSVVRLVAGLGNPGSEYDHTRHNIGFVVLDLLAYQLGVSWQRSTKWDAVWAKAGNTLLVKPWSFMNRSGVPLLKVSSFYKIAPEEMLLISDDTALPIGRLRIRLAGSAGGHNGLESVFMNFATDEISRLRIGVGSPPPSGAVDFVLGRFFDEEKPVMAEAVKRAAEATKCAIDKGVVSAMNTFNKSPES